MKHIKSYEHTTEDKPQIGDYIIIKRSNRWSPHDENFSEYINNNIGQIIKPLPCKYKPDDEVTMSYIKKGYFYVKYSNVPNIFYWGGDKPTKQKPILNCWWDIENHAILVGKNEILAYGKSIEEVKIKLASNKYNI